MRLMARRCGGYGIGASELKIYPGGTHSLGDTSKDKLNADLLASLES